MSVRTPPKPSPRSLEEREMVLRTLQRTRANITQAARQLKVSRVTIYRMLERNRIVLQQQYVAEELLHSSIHASD